MNFDMLLKKKDLYEQDRISIGGKEMQEIYEVVNHNDAFQYMKKCI